MKESKTCVEITSSEMNNPSLDIRALKRLKMIRLLRAKYDQLNNDTLRNFKSVNSLLKNPSNSRFTSCF